MVLPLKKPASLIEGLTANTNQVFSSFQYVYIFTYLVPIEIFRIPEPAGEM